MSYISDENVKIANVYWFLEIAEALPNIVHLDLRQCAFLESVEVCRTRTLSTAIDFLPNIIRNADYYS